MKPWLFKYILNIWPPFLGAGIKVTDISQDYAHVKVILKQKWYNRNYVGTHFGGSLFAMTDAFYMLMLLHILGRKYIVWDKASKIEFLKPARGTVKASFDFTPAEIQAIRKQADLNGKYIFDKTVEIYNPNNEVVASVVKTLYVRVKKT